MKRLTNETLKKEFKKVTNNLIIAIVCIALGMLCIGLGYIAEKRVPKDTKYLNDVIESETNDREDVKAHVEVSMKPVYITKINNTKYYIIGDDKYYFIAALNDTQYSELSTKDFDKETVKIYGETKAVTSSIKSYAKSYFNRLVDEEYKITTDEDFYNAFGDMYLDASNQDIGSIILIVLGALSNLVGYCFLLAFAIMKIRLNNSFKKITDEELAQIESEIDDKDSFHYERAHLILTKNYIISFLTGFKALRYEDIIWIYEYRLRQYGMTTQKSIMVMDKTGKVKPIITLDGLTKKSKVVFNEIADTIVSKNDKILVGYNKENKKKIKEEYNF